MDAGIVEFKIATLDGTVHDQTEGYSWKPAERSIFEKAITLRQPVFGDAFRNPDGEARLGIVVPIFSEAAPRASDNRLVEAIAGIMSIEMRLGPIVDLVEAHEGIGSTSESHIAQTDTRR